MVTKLFIVSVGYVVVRVECCRFESRGREVVNQGRVVGDEVVSWFNDLDRKHHTSIVLVISAKSPNQSISSHAWKSSLQRSWSLVLCSRRLRSISGVSIVVDEEQRNLCRTLHSRLDL